MNTVLLATESNYLPPMVIPPVAHGSNMDVDNEAFQRVVWFPLVFLFILGVFVSPMFLALVKNLHFPQTSELTDLLESGLSDVINQLQLT